MVSATQGVANAAVTPAGVVVLVSENYVCQIVPMQANASTAYASVLMDTATHRSLLKKKIAVRATISAQIMANATHSRVNVNAHPGSQERTALLQYVRMVAPVTDRAC